MVDENWISCGGTRDSSISYYKMNESHIRACCSDGWILFAIDLNLYIKKLIDKELYDLQIN